MNQNAGVISKSTTNERIAECRATLERIGLGNYQAEFHVHPWQFKETYVVCDLKGQAIICRNRWADHIAESFNQIHGQSIEPMVLRKPDNSITVFIMQRTITLPERHTLKSFTQYFDRFYPGFQADSEYVTFPKATRAYGTPCEFEREEDAYEAAEVLGVVTGFNTDVFETTTGYTAVIYDDSENLIDYNAIAVLGASLVLQEFSCSHKQKPQTDSDGCGDDPVAWQKRIGEKHSQQKRIELGVNRMLAFLEQASDGA